LNEEERFIVDNFTWSFSRLNNFYNGCHYEFKKHYIDCEPTRQGFHGAAGGYAHEVLEKYAKNELDIFTVSQYFEDHFNEEVPYDAPPNRYKDLKRDWYDKVLDYFNNIDLPIDDYKILGVEKEVKFEIEGYPFIGYIDLLLRDPKDGKLILCDHKSSSIKTLKSGKIAKADQEHFLAFKRQQYLYSKPIIEEYGDNIKWLQWNMFKDHSWITIPFSKREYNEALSWAADTIHKIENETDWDYQQNWFYCSFICCLEDCPFRNFNNKGDVD